MGDIPGASEQLIARALWTIAPRVCELRSETLPAVGPGEALVRTLVSGISGGTESLIFAGKVPPSEFSRMRAPFQSGAFPFPVKYGYAAVGEVEAGPEDWIGARVFVLHPHQDRFIVPVAALTRVSETIPPERAVLSANLETALNAVWDANLAPGERVAIIGAGVVGSLIAAIVSRMPAVELTLFDTDASRASRADVFGAAFRHSAGGAGQDAPIAERDFAGGSAVDFTGSSAVDFASSSAADFDCVFHTSGHGGGLTTALEIAGFEARIIELSWYGDAPVTVSLGQSFHSRRLQIISSQVGMVAAARRTRFDYKRRMAVVQRLLEDERLDALLGAHVDFDTLPARIGATLTERAGLCPLIRYR